MSFLGNALITKIKNMHANSLKEQDYLELLKKRSVVEITGYLKKHPAYADVLKNVSEVTMNRGRLEALIRRESFNRLSRLIRFMHLKDRGFYQLNFLHREHEVILTMIRSFISHEEYDAVADLPYYFDHYSKIDFESLAMANDMQSLVEALQDTRYYKMLKPYAKVKNDDIKYYEFESLFETDYYQFAFEQINNNYRGKLKKDLEDTFKSRIEMENMIKVYRLKKFYKVKNEDIKAILIPSTRISEKKIDEILLVNNPDEIFQKIIKTGMATYTNDKDQVYLEYYADHLRYTIAKKYMYFATHPAKVFLAYMFLSELEIENLTHLIEGIRYDVSEEEIRTMLVF